MQVVLVCSEGDTSSLAAAALQDLGLFRATDLIGGFNACHAAGLPTTGPRTAPASSSPADDIGGPSRG